MVIAATEDGDPRASAASWYDRESPASPISSSNPGIRVAASAKRCSARCSATQVGPHDFGVERRSRAPAVRPRACSPYGRITSCSAIRGGARSLDGHRRARAQRDELVDIDREATGFDRAIDHEYYEVGCRAQPLRIVPAAGRSASPTSSLPQPWATNRWILLTLAVVPGFDSGDAVCAAARVCRCAGRRPALHRGSAGRTPCSRAARLGLRHSRAETSTWPRRPTSRTRSDTIPIRASADLGSVASWICAGGSSPNTTACGRASCRASATLCRSSDGRSGRATAVARSRTSYSTRRRIRTWPCHR